MASTNNTDLNTLQRKCKRLGYSMTFINNGYSLRPLKRGLTKFFYAKNDLVNWIIEETERQNSDFFLMDWGK